jgi:hypothetical protein
MFSDIRTEAELRTDMFNNKASMDDDDDLELMYQFDEGTGTSIADVSDNSNTGTITVGGSAWAGAGTFTVGTSTLVMSGSSKYINYTSYEDVASLQISGTTTLRDISGDSRRLRVTGVFTVDASKTLSSDDEEAINLNVSASSLVINNAATGISGLWELHLQHVSGTINLPPCTTKRLWGENNGITTATGDVTLTERLRIASAHVFNANGNTIACKQAQGQGTSTLNLSNSTLNFSVSATDDLFSMVDGTTLTTGNTTITGYASATKTPATLPSAGDFEVVGDVKWLDIQADGDLTVIGAVIDCSLADSTANIRQWHHTLDTQQLLDADSAGDDDLRLTKPALDNAHELMTG